MSSPAVKLPPAREALRLAPASVAPPVSVIVYCYDQVRGISSLLGRLETLAERGWQFIFVDDGGGDATFEVLLAAACTRPWMRVVRHASHLGRGAAIRNGLAQTRAAIVCTMDSDCAYGPERLPELVALVEQGADIVTASRWDPECVPTPRRRLRIGLNRAVSALCRVLVGRDVHPLTCLYRAYRREVLEATQPRTDGAAAVAEVMLRGLLQGRRISEIPIQLGAESSGTAR